MRIRAAQSAQNPVDDTAHRIGGLIRVCLASPLFPPDYSGAAVRFQRYAPGLLARGVALEVVATEVGAWRQEQGYPEWCDKATEWVQPADELEIHRVPMPELSLEGLALTRRKKQIFEEAVVARCREFSPRPDVLVWLYSPTARALLRLARLWREGIPMVCAETMYDASPLPGWHQWRHRVAKSLTYRFMDRMVVGTVAMRDSLGNSSIRGRTEVIPHGVDLERFRPALDPEERIGLKSRLGLGNDSEVVLFVGPVNERKGVLQLTEAWSRVAESRPKAKLMLVGPEPGGSEDRDSFAARVRARFAEGIGADRVRFVGSVGDVENYFRAADVFVFPSRREGMPNAVCEALASGLPSILTPFLGISEELGQPGREYILVEREPRELAEAIVTLLADDQIRQRLRLAARRWAEERLDVRESLDRWAGLCGQLARRRSRATV